MNMAHTRLIALNNLALTYFRLYWIISGKMKV